MADIDKVYLVTPGSAGSSHSLVECSEPPTGTLAWLDIRQILIFPNPYKSLNLLSNDKDYERGEIKDKTKNDPPETLKYS